MNLVDHAKTSTLPKLLQRNAEESPTAPGEPRQPRCWERSWRKIVRQLPRLGCTTDR